MKRTHLNALIDVVAFIAFLALLSTGLLLSYQLPPGSGGRIAHGSGYGAAERPVQLVWGWSRHEWGDIHYWIALAMMAVLAIHLVLHWKWIVGVVRGKTTSASGYRLALGCVGLIFVILLSVVPLVSPVSSAKRTDHREQGVKSENGLSKNEEIGEAPLIRGSMTLREIAAASRVSQQEIIKTLGLSSDIDVDEGVGRILRRHDLTMSDLRDALNRIGSAQPAANSTERIKQ